MLPHKDAEIRQRCWHRASTGADLIFHGAICDLVNEGVMEEDAAAKFVGEAIINEILDHGLRLDPGSINGWPVRLVKEE